jgi:hypothetical protein
VDRYHQLLARVPPGAVHDRLHLTGARLAAALHDVHTACVSAQQIAPSDGEDLPGGRGGVLLDAHRALARGATLAAQAGETVMLAVVALRGGQLEEATRLADAAARTADHVADQVRQAGELVAAAAGP